jgi:hypothetical protein
MPTSSLLRNIVIIATTLIPVQALADVVLISPLVPSRGVDAERVQDLFTLMTSELEFMEDVDEVIELNPAPSSLDLKCLDSTRCLGTLTRNEEADVMVTGSVAKDGSNLALDLLFYDSEPNRVLRRETFTISSEPSAIINGITAILIEVMTGVSPKKEEAESEMADVDFGDDLASDDYDDASGSSDYDLDSFDDDDELSGYDDDDDDVADGDQSEQDDFDPSMISFGSAGENITFGTVEDDDIVYGEDEQQDDASADQEDELSFDDDEPEPSFDDDDDGLSFDDDDDDEPAARPEPTRRETPEADDDPLDLDRPQRGRTSTNTSSRTTRARSSSSDDGYRRVHINLRGGYSTYGSATNASGKQVPLFNFGTVSAELQVRATKGLFIAAGIDGNFVQRELPPGTPVADDNGVARRACITPPRTTPDGRLVELNCIWPIHVGLLYRFKAGIAQPYIGADAIFTQYYQQPTTGQQAWAAGGRARLGIDLFVTDAFGFNIDLALGAWQGAYWDQVDPRLPSAGFLPTASAGILLGF